MNDTDDIPAIVTASMPTLSGRGIPLTDGLTDYQAYLLANVKSKIVRAGFGLDVTCLSLTGNNHGKITEWLAARGMIGCSIRAVARFLQQTNPLLTADLRKELLSYVKAKLGVPGLATLDDTSFRFSRITMVDTLMRMVESLGRRIVQAETRNSPDLDEQKLLLECYKEYRALRKSLEEEIRTSEVEATRTKTIKEVGLLALGYISGLDAKKQFAERVKGYEQRATPPVSG